MSHLHGAVRDRLSRASGHLASVLRMVEQQDPYPDVLLQMAAVRGALDKATGLILEDMLEDLMAAPKAEHGVRIRDLREGLRVIS